jgi:Na+(H+)/acetate symporter ActP
MKWLERFEDQIARLASPHMARLRTIVRWLFALGCALALAAIACGCRGMALSVSCPWGVGR